MKNTFFSKIFGCFNWSSPPWVKYLSHQFKTRPIAFWSFLFGIIILLLLAVYGCIWYKSLPRPDYITAVITAPKITPITDDELQPEALTIDFGKKHEQDFAPQSVAALALLHQEIKTGISMVPAVKGRWFWQSDSRIIFEPAQDWPAAQSFTIQFAQDLFRPATHLESSTAKFSTLPFDVQIDNFKFYQDPVDFAQRYAVATLHFNFPVDPASLENKTHLFFEGLKNDTLDEHSKHITLSFTYDKYKRTAYIHSAPLSLSDVARYLQLTIDKSLLSATGAAKTTDAVSSTLLIPDKQHYFNIKAVNASIIRNAADKPEQVFTIETSIGVRDVDMNKALLAYLLPENYPATAEEAEKKHYVWNTPGEVNEAILKLSTPVSLHALASEHTYSTLHSYLLNAPTPRYLYIKLKKGIQAFENFTLADDYTAIIEVPQYPKEISFLHPGSLLALSGEQKLSVLVRGLAAVKFQFARVLSTDVNQLVTQTAGDMGNPYFVNEHFNQQNISEIFSEVRQFNVSDLSKPNYTALDFSKYWLAGKNATGPRGLFLLQAQAWDVENEESLDVKSTRLILMTDLSLIVKDNQDGSHWVFVQSITNGKALADVHVQVLGKNGLALVTKTTDGEGKVFIPSLVNEVDAQEPVAYLASLGTDVSFIPYTNAGRQLNYSRFDTGGVYTNRPEESNLSAYIFSDRGIYRPGDTAHLAMIIKQPNVVAAPKDVLLQATIMDPRGTVMKDVKLALSEEGYLSIDFSTNNTSPTGQYTVSLYVVKDEHPANLLGSTTFQVAEFQPDRLRIHSSLSDASKKAWVSPQNLQANVELFNLYGAPATNHLVKAKLLLQPIPVKFSSYPQYIFEDPMLQKTPQVFTDELPSLTTDDKGQAKFNLHLERFDNAAYELSFFAEGFEAEGGRSVTTQTKALVSPMPYFVGYKPDGDLRYIKKNAVRKVNFIALDANLNPQDLQDMKIEVSGEYPVSTLVKTKDATYQYQTITQTKVLSSEPLVIKNNGTDFTLPTSDVGSFVIRVLDDKGNMLTQFKFKVAGESQTTLAKNAELSIQLDKQEYQAGEEIELQITAPYAGSGLITIERDKVYSSQWFKTEHTNSVQKIRIPPDFEGNGYVNVTFARDWNSPDIFVSPLSYSVESFKVSYEKHAIHLELGTPALAKPGQPLTIEYASDKPGKIIVFAVDEGILQVARYKTPDPLAFFFEKKALQVITQQTVDLILPQYLSKRELSAVGGDDGEAMLSAHLNPFKRKTDLPVVFWSGILEVDAKKRSLTYDVPDYFNGTLQIMAVAVSENSVGASQKDVQIRGDFIISPNVPTFVAPQDEFDVSAAVANYAKDSGPNAQVSIELEVTDGLEIIGQSQETLVIPEGNEKSIHFKLRASSKLGSSTVILKAHVGNYISVMKSSLSIRPASQFFTAITSGTSQAIKTITPITRTLYPEYREVKAAMSKSPLLLAEGLERYLENFPYGCTEQLVSKAFPLISLKEMPGLTRNLNEITQKITATLQILRQRQMSDGSFSYWPGLGNNDANTAISLYAMHFLTDAREHGFEVSNDLMSAGINYLKEIAAQTSSNWDAIRLQTYAIYLLTRNEIVTTNYLTHVQLYFNQNPQYQHELTGAYIAATYALLKNNQEATRLIREYKIQTKSANDTDFYNADLANAQYLYLIEHHFPEQLSTLGEALILRLVEALNQGEMNTLLSSYLSLALEGYTAITPSTNPEFNIKEILANKQQVIVADSMNSIVQGNVDQHAESIQFLNPNQQRFFYQLTQVGFDKDAKTTPISKGIEVYREYRDSQGNGINHITLGEELEVYIRIRALEDRYIQHVAIVDLLPGGFEIVRNSVKGELLEYYDIREDRVNFFTSLEPTIKEIRYRIKPTNVGSYQVPAIFAEAMYDHHTQAFGASSTIRVDALRHG